MAVAFSVIAASVTGGTTAIDNGACAGRVFDRRWAHASK